MPTYEELLVETTPAAIETREDYEKIGDRLGALLRRGSQRTKAETRLMRLLALLIEDYDRRHALPPSGDSPADTLLFLLAHSGKTAADLSTIFGARSHVNEALNGKRPISAEHARRLGKLFSVRPGLFI